MKTNWLKTVNSINQQRYVVPDGWETRDQVADSLQCDPQKVADLVKPGIESGEIERQMFSVWDESRRMAVSTTCYRLKGPSGTQPANDSLRARIVAAIARNPSYSNSRIAKSFRGVSAGDVAALRS